MRPIWNRLPVEKGKREELARLTGISATNLSAMNTGNMPTTIEAATRIADAVEGVTVFDLGAPAEAVSDPAALLVIDRLGSLEETAARATDLARVDRVLRAAIQFLASGDAEGALRVLSAEEGP